MNQAHRPSPSAEKQRRYRRRQRVGVQVVGVEIDAAVIEALLRRGWIGENEATDRNALSNNLADLLECWADGRLTENEIHAGTVTRNAPGRPALASSNSREHDSEHKRRENFGHGCPK